ncbi:aspartate kinase [Patescibacteria group bacterium]
MNSINTITAKFGGSSMQDAESIRRVADIIQDIPAQQAVVVSATAGTTDHLINLANISDNEQEWRRSFDSLIERHQQIIQELGVDLEFQEIWNEVESIRSSILEALDPNLELLDQMQVIGERISSQILAAYLNNTGVRAQSVDAYDLIQTDNSYGNANVHFEQTTWNIRERIGELLQQGIIPVITGFNGCSEEGRPITLGRGGSDYSAAIVGAALDSEEVQIWTDVSGIFNADPRYISEARPLEQVSFEEAGELAYFGAKVLHPKTIEPARHRDIPVRILNTFSPEENGTVIQNYESNSIKSVTFKEGARLVNIHSAGMLNAHGFLSRIFEVFARYEVVVDVVSTSVVSVSLTVDHPLPSELVEELNSFSSVEEVNSKAIVCLVGDGIARDTSVLGRLFSSIMGHEVFMVSQGASQRNITFLVEESEVIKIIQKVFNTFFNSIEHAN